MAPQSLNASSRRRRILSGVQPSGRLHLGTFFGAMHQFIKLQNDGEALYFIANLHALSTVRDAQRQEHTLEAALAYLSLGLDPQKAVLFRQSDVPEITELFWILGSLVPISHLERARGYKDKVARAVAANFGLLITRKRYSNPSTQRSMRHDGAAKN